MKRLLAVLACVAAAACGQPRPPMSDWEREREERLPLPEQPVPPSPPYPDGRSLVEFYVAATSGFRFFVDAATLTVAGGVVHYVLVARSDQGAQNVSYEGMRCATREVRLYAVGRDGRWGSRPGVWHTIEARSVQRWHNALYREFFCPQSQVVASAGEAIGALRRRGMQPPPPDQGM